MAVPCLVCLCLSVSALISVLFSSLVDRPPLFCHFARFALLSAAVRRRLFVSRRGDFTDSQLNALIRCHQSQLFSVILRAEANEPPFPFAFLFLIIPFAFSVLEFRVPLPFLSLSLTAHAFAHAMPYRRAHLCIVRLL